MTDAELGIWSVTEDEHNRLAATIRHAYNTAYFPNENMEAWGSLSTNEQSAWRNAVAVLLFHLDSKGKTVDTVVIDYD